MKWLKWAIPSTMVRENSKISRYKVTKISHSFHHDWRKFWKHQGMIWQNEIFHGKETLKIRKIITLHPKSLPSQKHHQWLLLWIKPTKPLPRTLDFPILQFWLCHLQHFLVWWQGCRWSKRTKFQVFSGYF